MDNREFHALYHAAWQKNVSRIKAEEEAQKAEREAAKKKKPGSGDTQGERLAALRSAITPDMIEEMADEME